jgi:5-formyltetrahydrofolate cyclo-ligase
MRSHELKRAKRAIRRAVLARRDAMSSADRAREGTRAIERFLEVPSVTTADTVVAFWPFGSELDTRPLLEILDARGVRIALPRIEGEDLSLRTWSPGEPMTPTSFGAMEPADGERIDPRQAGVVCTPGIAFDPWGGRIGYGGGFYDRLFGSAIGAIRVALAFDLQVIDEPLPLGHFDERVHVIVTPTRTIAAAEQGHGDEPT